MFGVKGILILVTLLMLFGGAVYDITTTAGRCALAVSQPQLGYDCDDLISTLGRTVISPDRNIRRGTEGIMVLRNLDNQTLSEIGVLRDAQISQFNMQIILGWAGFLVLFAFLAYVFIHAGPASSIDAGSLAIAIFAAFMIMAVASAIFDDNPEHGAFAIFGERTPFKGIRLFLANPDVMSSVVDETSVLPGTLEVDDITGDAT